MAEGERKIKEEKVIEGERLLGIKEEQVSEEKDSDDDKPKKKEEETGLSLKILMMLKIKWLEVLLKKLSWEPKERICHTLI